MTIVTLGRMTLLLLLFTLTIPDPSDAEIFFDSDFELGAHGDDWASNGWNDFGQAEPGHLEITTDLDFTGTHSVKGTFDGKDLIAGNSQQPSIYRSWGGSTHIFARFATRQSPGFQICDNGHTKMVRFKDDVGYPLTWILYRHGQYHVIMEGPYDQAGTNILTTGVVPSQTAWDQIEFEYQLNTPGQSNGLMRLWINGVLRAEQLNRAYIGPTPTSRGASGLLNPSTLILRTAQIYIQCGLGAIYYDRFAVGDTRIGLATSQTSSDTTPPVAPSGLAFR